MLWLCILKERKMIKKTNSGYQVTSEKGKPLSKPNLTKQQAEKRLKQVEYYKKEGSNSLFFLTLFRCIYLHRFSHRLVVLHSLS